MFGCGSATFKSFGRNAYSKIKAKFRLNMTKTYWIVIFEHCFGFGQNTKRVFRSYTTCDTRSVVKKLRKLAKGPMLKHIFSS